MASLPSKGSDLKKSPPKVLSPSNGPADKTFVTKSSYKSPPAKLTAKSPLKSNDTGKISLTKGKMDSSPPKVARSPSNKSITPPGKSPTKGLLSCSIKPTLDKSNSQGDIAVPSSLKNAVTGIVPLDNEVTNTAEAKPTETVLESDTQATESTAESEPKTDEPAVNSATCSSVGDASSSDSANATKLEQTLDQQQIAISEQKHASGDGAPAMNEKIDEVESAGESAFASETKQSDKLENYENFTQHLPSSGVTLTVVKKEKPDVDATDAVKATGTDEVKTESNDDVKQDKTDKEPTEDSASTPNTSTSDYTNMSAETIDAAKVAEVSETNDENITPEVSKQSYRQKVWDHLEKDDLVLFPRPCSGRIPNFKGAHQAAEKLASSKVFKNCKTIKVNPDKAQEMVRFHTLEHGKRLLVPIPRLREGLFQAVVPPFDASKYQLQQASQRFGMKKWGKPVSLDDKLTIDMVVLGSVAVDKKGHRIGKGEGYADLEFAMLTKMNAINENTVIVTTVHDDQVFDDLPAELFKEHDVPVDWIVTPTQIIQVAEPLERPKQVIWSILSNRRVLEMPILQKLREQETSEGIECTLKEVDSDVEEKTYPVQESVFKKRFQHRRRRFNNYSRSTGDPIRDSKLAASNIPPPSTPHGAPASMPYYNNNRQQRRYSPNNNRMRDYNHDGRHDGRRYDGGVQQPNRRNYYQNAPPPPQYGMQHHQQHQPYNGRQPMRQDGQNRSMNRNGPMMNGPRNMNRSAQNGPRMGRQRSDNRPPNNAMTKSVEVQTVDKSRTSRPFVKRKRAPIEFSLRVKNIGTGVRVRDLKTALNERGIKPRVITWKGHRGFAFLHFVKSASNENKPLAVEDVIHALEGLPLPPKNKRNLVIEPAKPKNSASESSGGVEESPSNTTITLETAVPKEPPVLNVAVPPTINQPIAV